MSDLKQLVDKIAPRGRGGGMSEPQETGPEVIRVFPHDAPSDTWQLLEKRGCVTTREAALALGITRKAAWNRLSRLKRRGYVETRLVDGVVWWCLARPSAPPRRRTRGPSRATLMRAEAVSGLIEREGCVTTDRVMKTLGLSATQARYVLYALLSQGRIVEKVVGVTALWCRDSAAAHMHVEALRGAVRRLIYQNDVKYVTVTKIIELIRRDREAHLLFSKYISLERHGRGFPAASLGFINDILTSLYGEPAIYGGRLVYFVQNVHTANAGLEALPYHVRCCALLKAHIENRLATSRGGVISVKSTHLTKNERFLPRFASCLSKLLRPYRRGSSYVVPRGEAQALLSRLGQLCESIHKKRKKAAARRITRRDTQVVAFHVTRDELEALDKYAEEAGVTRSDVVRLAIMRMIEKFKTAQYADWAR